MMHTSQSLINGASHCAIGPMMNAGELHGVYKMHTGAAPQAATREACVIIAEVFARQRANNYVL